MQPPPIERLEQVGKEFRLLGRFVHAARFGSGHINNTYLVTYDQGGARVRYIHQRINREIFRDPVALMSNVLRVTERQREALGDHEESVRKALTVVETRDSLPVLQDENGDFWRTYLFIERTRSYDAVETDEQAFEAARAFGSFQSLVADLDDPRLHETIPHFHDTPKRFDALVKAIESDPENRAASVKHEIEFVMKRRDMLGVLTNHHANGDLPERVTHNDTKLNNVLFDSNTGEGLCVIDLDTVMPGLALYDFGDMVRTTTCPAREDEQDLSKVHMDMAMFKALTYGYLDQASSFLTPLERDLLAFSGKLITMEIGIRFLTDHLNGDVYFATHRPNHNLDRCRTQFKLAESIENQEAEMESVVAHA
jgi:hypothetical protein